MSSINAIQNSTRYAFRNSDNAASLGSDFASMLTGTHRGGLKIGPPPAPQKSGVLVAGMIPQEKLSKAGRADPAAPTYSTKLPDTRETRRRYFSENTVQMNTAVVSHQTSSDAPAGRAIVRALHEANPKGKIALLVQDYDKRDPSQLTELAKYYGLPESAFAPIRVNGHTAKDLPISLWPQDGFMAGAAGLNEPRSGTRHAGEVAEAISRATGLKVNNRDYLGMGGDTHFLTRPNGEQVAYFSRDTIDHALESINRSRPSGKQLKPGNPMDHLLTIGHVMANMNDAGVALKNAAPLGVSPSGRTYGSVMDSMSRDQLAELRPNVVARLHEMRHLPFPEVYPTNAKGYNYHTDLVMASPDGVHAYVNSDDLSNIPGWRRQLEFFGYKPVPLPATYAYNDFHKSTERTSYTNWIMGEVNGKTVILLPTEGEDPAKLTANDRAAIAAFGKNNPNVKIIPMGANTTRMFQHDPKTGGTRDWGAHCRTNVLPWILEPAKAGTSSFKGAAANDVGAPASEARPKLVAAY
jgi:hypothetical protein